MTRQRITDFSDDVAPSEWETFNSSGPYKIGGDGMGGSTSDARSAAAAAALSRMLTVDSPEDKNIVITKADNEPDQVLREPGSVHTPNPAFLEPGSENSPDRVLNDCNPGHNPDLVLPETTFSSQNVMDLEGGFSPIEEPAVAMCRRLDEAMEELSHEASSLQTLLKIIR